MMQVELMPGGVWMGPPGAYSLSVLHVHGKGVLVLIAWELGTAAWQVEMALRPLAHCMPYSHGRLFLFQANGGAQTS